MTAIHPAAQRGFSAGAGTYQRGRPDYPVELLGWLRDELHVGPGRSAVDLGAGTGKFTRLLVKTGADITAVEPVDAMRAELASALPLVRQAAGSAQAIPFDDSSVDAVLCAQSFHWFASAAALEEIHRVLRPGGMLGLVWNVRDDSVDWVAAVNRLMIPYEGDAPRFQSEEWRRPFEGRLFTDLLETRFGYRHVGPAREVIVDRFMSVSFIAALPSDEKRAIGEKLASLIASHPALQGREPIQMPYVTRAFRCTRR